MKLNKTLFLTLAFAAASLPSLSFAAKPAAPKTFDALCLVFTWSEDGSVEPETLLIGTKFKLKVGGPRTEVLRTKNAIYQAVVSEMSPDHVFLDVLKLSGSRIASSEDQVTIGPDVAEPGVHTHFQCFDAKELDTPAKK